jgi:hypothetical protein
LRGVSWKKISTELQVIPTVLLKSGHSTKSLNESDKCTLTFSIIDLF